MFYPTNNRSRLESCRSLKVALQCRTKGQEGGFYHFAHIVRETLHSHSSQSLQRFKS